MFYGPEEARRRARRYETISRTFRKAIGACIDCGERRKRFKRKDRVRCRRCLAVNAKAVRNRRVRAVNTAFLAGNCVNCKAHPAMEGRKRCQNCYEVGRIAMRRYHDIRRVSARKQRSDTGTRKPLEKRGIKQ